MMRRLLLSCRATSVEASNAEAANRLLQDCWPTLILSDIGMPGTDGYQFIQEVRRRGVTVPAVALTAFARSEDRVRSIQAVFKPTLVSRLSPPHCWRSSPVCPAASRGSNPRPLMISGTIGILDFDRR